MTNREIEYDPGFASKLKKLSRRHHGLRESIDTRIAEIASGKEENSGNKIPGLDGKPVFKKRVEYANLGKRNAARIIYYLGDEELLALFIHLKSDRTSIPVKEIKKMLAKYAL